ncbi:hypothetical protein RRG08_005074 [Elysia crispata]|uniref:Uncharacterized protein n=1 Tax=Elysia crispata TaxID=231223 RepID=A0AAE0Y036_9GAST|nr:hypothetical protein RRG08_005074 [Elysia crispata]
MMVLAPLELLNWIVGIRQHLHSLPKLEDVGLTMKLRFLLEQAHQQLKQEISLDADSLTIVLQSEKTILQHQEAELPQQKLIGYVNSLSERRETKVVSSTAVSIAVG